MVFKYTKMICLLLLLVLSIQAQTVQITASVDQTTLAVNQQLVLSVELTGEDANRISSVPPPDGGDYLRFYGSRGTSQNIQFINGKTSISITHTFVYLAVKAGSYTIPPVTLKYKDKTYQSNSIPISIIKAGTSSSGSQGESNVDDGEELFLRVLYSKQRVYPNEPVIVTFRIYAKVSVTGINPVQMPETTGFWAEEFDLGTRLQTQHEVYKGVRYAVADIKKYALFPTSSGKKTIGPLKLDCQVRVRNRRQSRDIFDSFFNDSFFSRTVTRTISSKPVAIEVLPFPAENKPSGFSGLAGRFDLNATLDKNSVKTNEGITLRVKISGQGNISIIPKPDLFIPADFEQYEPTVTQNINRSGNGISGHKTFEYVLIPRFPGQQRIRPFAFSYFDTGKKDYVTLRSPEFTINVEKGDQEYNSGVGSGFSKEEIELIGQDIRFIKLHSPRFLPLESRFYQSFYFVALLVFPALLFLFALAYQRHMEKLNKNRAYARSRGANRLAKKRLSQTKAYLSESTQKEFYSEMSRALLGFAADKLNISSAGIISTELEKSLKARGLDAELVDRYIALIQKCDLYRFATTSSSREEMEQTFKKANEAIIKLEKAL
jgi:hypothetical protein